MFFFLGGRWKRIKLIFIDLDGASSFSLYLMLSSLEQAGLYNNLKI